MDFSTSRSTRDGLSLTYSLGQNFVYLVKSSDMNTLVIENKSYAVVPMENYQALR
jgi:hypothetical protein